MFELALHGIRSLLNRLIFSLGALTNLRFAIGRKMRRTTRHYRTIGSRFKSRPSVSTSRTCSLHWVT